MTPSINVATRPAVVARGADRPHGGEQYLVVSPRGETVWTSDLRAATPFESMREATRAALRLASGVRAFGLPLGKAPTAQSLH